MVSHTLLRFTLCTVVAGLAIIYLSSHLLSFDLPILPIENSNAESRNTFSWDAAIAHSDLVFSDCHEGHQCARLWLPMDYWNGTTDAKVNIAIVRKPAKVPVTHPRYGGAVLLNPGGPGGLGTEFVLEAGEQISAIIDSEDEEGDGKYFDLISFDPRGIGHSEPSVSCFDDTVLGQVWDIRMLEGGLPDVNDAAFGRIWALARARATSCSTNLPDGKADIRKYVSTASVARDMVEIIEKLGQWREEEAKKLQSKYIARPAFTGSGHELFEATRYHPGEEKLQYWGFSYGSFLGLTFASMFPGRVNRLAIDGVMDPDDYIQGRWFTSLADAERAMDSFFSSCAKAGYPLCALANGLGETTPSDVKQRTQKIIKKLVNEPLAVLGPNPEIVTAADIANMIFLGLYRPVESFPAMAKILADIESGDGTALAAMLLANHGVDCAANQSGIAAAKGYSSESLMAVSCTDGDDQTDLTQADYARYLSDLSVLSPTLAPLWSLIRLHCMHYPVRAAHRFTGPFKSKPETGLLLIANTADPYTPLANAQRLEHQFSGSRAIALDAPGHCSLGTASGCLTRHVRRYFQTGALPDEGVVCGADERPFGLGKGAVGRVRDIAAAALTHGGFFSKLFGARRG